MIRSAAVLGAGTMGAQIAAHLANAGVPTLLLDLTGQAARDGFARARRAKPNPFFSADVHPPVSTGGFDDDLARIADCDWIIEAIVERFDAKRGLLAKVETHRRPGAIVSSNTSGIPLADIATGRSDEFRRHWLGTHFFNPPRYLRLLEVIPILDTDPAVVRAISEFADHRLGKGVVVARDSPGFIGNRIGLYGVMRAFESLAGGYTVEEIDALSGPALGRPRSATFRTMDIAGLDILTHVAQDLTERLEDPAERTAFAIPPLLEKLVERGWIGEKAGQGLYRRQPAPDGGGSEIWALDPQTLDYRPRRPVQLPALDAIRSNPDPADRIRSLFSNEDRSGAFVRAVLGATLLYSARVAPRIAHSIDDVDRAMRWGFGWELGPFEIWDAIGLREVLEACPTDDVPSLVQGRLAQGENRFRDRTLPPAAPDLQILRAARDRNPIVKQNAAASLVDLGDGVLAVEFHSKLNTIGGDTMEMLAHAPVEAARNFQALVVGNDAADFSVGANLMMLLLEAQEENWDEVEAMVRTFQSVTMGLRYADVPVVVAPAGRTLGGGCELVLHGDRVQAAAETYMGLVEVGVGLIPAGGGTKEMVARSAETASTSDPAAQLDGARRAFETIALATTSSSGPDARRVGYLRETDGITMNRERLVADAKARALFRRREGYRPPPPRTAIPVGGESVLAALKLGVHLAWRAGRISDHDALIGRKLAAVVAGGAIPHPARVSEQYLLDLEREAFLSLCGEPRTQERIRHTLKTGKPLRN